VANIASKTVRATVYIPIPRAILEDQV